MKKIFFYIFALTLALNSCRKDEVEGPTYEEPEDINTRNTMDDQAIQKYLANNYLDNLGNIKAFSSTDDSDDNYPSLAALNPVTLPSGVIYIVRDGAQPNPGTAIGASDIIHLMTRTYTYIAYENEGIVSLQSPAIFYNTIDGSGVPMIDPLYYFTPQERIDDYNQDNGTSYNKSFFEIEGLREGLQHFQAFNMDDSDNYNLQGVIIVPSRAAFARDPHYSHNSTVSSLTVWQNRTFIFNFQVYKTIPRT